MIVSPPTRAWVRPIRSITGPDEEHERIHPRDVRPDDREDVLLLVPVLGHDDVAGQVHDADHDAEARQRGQKGRKHARAPEDLRERCGSGRGRGAARRSEQLGDPLRIRADGEDEGKPDDEEAAAREPGHDERLRFEVTSCEERCKHSRPENRSEYGAEEDERDPTRPALGRIHVSGRGPGQVRNSRECSDQRQARNQREGRLRVRGEGEQAGAGQTRDIARRQDRDPAEPVHGAPGKERCDGAAGQEDRGSEPQQGVDSRDEDEGDRRDRRPELQHAGDGRERRGQEDRVPGDRRGRATGRDRAHGRISSAPPGRRPRHRAKGA